MPALQREPDMRFGLIRQYVLFGGGQLLVDLASEIIQRQRSVRVVTSRRHALAIVTVQAASATLLDGLGALAVPTKVVADIETDPEVRDYITDGTLGISLGAEWIFRPTFIAMWKGRLVNLHATRLPRMRGGGGFSWFILCDDHRGGATIHLVDSGVDTGPIVVATNYFFPAHCTKPSEYQDVACRENWLLLRRFLDDVESNTDFLLIPQAQDASTYWPRLSTDVHGCIDWSWRADEIRRFVCAFDDPYKGAWTFLRGQRVHLKDCLSDMDDGTFHPFQRGLIYKRSPGAVFVAARDGNLVVRQVTDESGASVFDRLRAGDRFYTPNTELEAAVQYRARYAAEGL
jgi:methionyl-tRNA formyltransferase